LGYSLATISRLASSLSSELKKQVTRRTSPGVQRLGREWRDGILGVFGSRRLHGKKSQAVRVQVLVRRCHVLQHDLGAVERKTSGLDQAEAGQRLFPVGENLAHQVADTPQISCPGGESTDLEDCFSAGIARHRFQGIADLLRKQTLRRKRRDAKGEPPRFADDCGGEILGNLETLRLLFFLLLALPGGAYQRKRANQGYPTC